MQYFCRCVYSNIYTVKMKLNDIINKYKQGKTIDAHSCSDGYKFTTKIELTDAGDISITPKLYDMDTLDSISLDNMPIHVKSNGSSEEQIVTDGKILIKYSDPMKGISIHLPRQNMGLNYNALKLKDKIVDNKIKE